MNQIVHREKILENLKLTNELKQAIREYMYQKEIDEYDTPILTTFCGEPYNRVFQVSLENEMVSLVDSPQVYKMLLLLRGARSYYQFAHCFRPIFKEVDQETRLREFIQLDVELHVSTLNGLIQEALELILVLFHRIGKGIRIEFMDGAICRKQFGDSMKPDLRKDDSENVLVIVTHLPFSNGEKMDGYDVPNHHVFAKPCGHSIEMNELTQMKTESFDLILNGIEIGGGDLRIMDAELQVKIMHCLNVNQEVYQPYLKELKEYQGKPIGGYAIGLQRLVMAITGISEIRDTVAFPEWR